MMQAQEDASSEEENIATIHTLTPVDNNPENTSVTKTTETHKIPKTEKS